MSHILVESLIRVLVDRNADAVVIDAGQPPYTLSPAGSQVEFAPQPATSDQVEAVLAETLTAGPRGVLDRLGAVEQILPPGKHFPDETLTLIAVRMHGIAWLEIRRERAPKPTLITHASVAEPTVEIPAEWTEWQPAEPAVVETSQGEQVPQSAELQDGVARQKTPQRRRRSSGRHPRHSPSSRRDRPMFVMDDRSHSRSLIGRLVRFVFSPILARRAAAAEAAEAAEYDWTPEPGRSLDVNSFALSFRAESDENLELPDASELWPDPPARPALVPGRTAGPEDWDLDHLFSEDGNLLALHRLGTAETQPTPEIEEPVTLFVEQVARPAVPPPVVAPPVLPAPAVAAAPVALPVAEVVEIDEETTAWAEPIVVTAPAPVLARLLATAATRGASTLHVACGSRPAIRVDAEIVFLDERPLSTADVDYLIAHSMPAGALKELRHEGRAEWIAEVPEMGRAVGSAFYDHRGLSAIFRVSVGRRPSADDLGLPPEAQALALEPEGLILVSGPRLSGRSDVLTAFVDLVNRLRRDYVIVLENEIHDVHEAQGCVISQRLIGGSSGDVLAAARTALHDDPDILVIEELQSDSMIRLALKAAAGGHLVIAGLPARTSTAAVEMVLDAYTREGRLSAQSTLSEHLCGVITQVMVRKFGGGSMIAREILLNTPNVAEIIGSGHTEKLPDAISAGSSDGMTSLADTIVDLVSKRVVGVHEASRRIGNRSAFVDLLRRRGIDTSVLGPL